MADVSYKAIRMPLIKKSCRLIAMYCYKKEKIWQREWCDKDMAKAGYAIVI
jgi:hypothetical protein